MSKKSIIAEEADLSGYDKYEGTLQTFHETGMECVGLVLVDKTKPGPPNPNFDPSKPEGGMNFRNYGNYDALHFIKHGDILQVKGGPRIGMMSDHVASSQDGYGLSFYCQGYDLKEWVMLFYPENIEATLWIPKKTENPSN